MKASVTTYSFSKLIEAGQMTQLDCIKKAKELGFDAIEFAGINPPESISSNSSNLIEYAKKISEELDKEQMPVANLTVAADFLNGSDSNLIAELERVKKLVDIAEIIGAKSMRHDVTVGYKPPNKYKSFDEVLPILAAACKEITEYAKTKGIKTMVENHGHFCQDSDRLQKLVTAVSDDNFGLLIDIGNFLCVDEEPAQAVGKLANYASFVHAKDFHFKSMLNNPGKGFFKTRAGNYLRGAIVGHGNVPVYQCLSILKRANYSGYVSIEFEGLEDPILALTIGLENLKAYC